MADNDGAHTTGTTGRKGAELGEGLVDGLGLNLLDILAHGLRGVGGGSVRHGEYARGELRDQEEGRRGEKDGRERRIETVGQQERRRRDTGGTETTSTGNGPRLGAD